MLNQGFQLDIEKIFEYVNRHTKEKPQTLMFSATLPSWIHEMSIKYQNQQKTKTRKSTSRIPGLDAGTTWVSDDFDEPLPDSFWFGES